MFILGELAGHAIERSKLGEVVHVEPQLVHHLRVLVACHAQYLLLEFVVDGLARGKAGVGGADNAGVLLGFIVPVELGTAEDKAALTSAGLDAHLAVAGHLAQLGLRANRAEVTGRGLFPGRADDILPENGAVLVDLDGLGLGALAVRASSPSGLATLMWPLPVTTTAFRLLEPKTAPKPPYFFNALRTLFIP